MPPARGVGIQAEDISRLSPVEQGLGPLELGMIDTDFPAQQRHVGPGAGLRHPICLGERERHRFFGDHALRPHASSRQVTSGRMSVRVDDHEVEGILFEHLTVVGVKRVDAALIVSLPYEILLFRLQALLNPQAYGQAHRLRQGFSTTIDCRHVLQKGPDLLAQILTGRYLAHNGVISLPYASRALRFRVASGRYFTPVYFCRKPMTLPLRQDVRQGPFSDQKRKH